MCFNCNSYTAAAAAAAKSLQSCPTLYDPIDSSPPGSPAPGILQARTLEWVAISFSNAWKWNVKVKTLKSSPTLSDHTDCSLPGSSVHGIFQARLLEWGAIAFSHTQLVQYNKPGEASQMISYELWQRINVIWCLILNFLFGIYQINYLKHNCPFHGLVM